MEEKVMSEERVLYLTNRWVIALFAYYFSFLSLGVTCAILAIDPSILFDGEQPIIRLAILGSVGMASNGASIFYIRKLYKLCFTEKLKLDEGNQFYIRRVGTIIYFFGRPLFSVGFSILVILGMKSGFMAIIEKPFELNDGFIYTVMFVSFFVGFLSGRFVKKLESYGSGVINEITKAR